MVVLFVTRCTGGIDENLLTNVPARKQASFRVLDNRLTREWRTTSSRRAPRRTRRRYSFWIPGGECDRVVPSTFLPFHVTFKYFYLVSFAYRRRSYFLIFTNACFPGARATRRATARIITFHRATLHPSPWHPSGDGDIFKDYGIAFTSYAIVDDTIYATPFWNIYEREFPPRWREYRIMRCKSSVSD